MFKLETIVSSSLIPSTLLSSWVLSQVWNIKSTTSLYFQQRKSPEFWTTKWSKDGTWFHSFAKTRFDRAPNFYSVMGKKESGSGGSSPSSWALVLFIILSSSGSPSRKFLRQAQAFFVNKLEPKPFVHLNINWYHRLSKEPPFWENNVK